MNTHRKPIWGRLALLPILVLLLLSSCSVKKVVYFNDLPDTAYMAIKAAQYKDPVILPNDILNITIQTIDPATAAVVNQAMNIQAVGSNTAINTGNQVISGFQVDERGEIQMALLGRVKVEGLTISQVRDRIIDLASKYYKDPTVQVRFANFKVTVLGEVARPATYTVPNDRVSLLDALGLAGDLTIHGRRDNVLLLREQDGQQQLVRLNLNDSKVLESPYFYLRQNDVLYIEPGKGKAASTNAARTQTIAIIGSLLSVILVGLTRL